MNGASKVDQALRLLDEAQRETWGEGKAMPQNVADNFKTALDKADALTRQPTTQAVIPTLDGSSSSGGASPGATFAKSPTLAAYAEAGFPRNASGKCAVGSFFETKAVPTFGSGVIMPSRDGEIVRTAGQDRLAIRSVLAVAPTSSNAVEYVRITSAQPTTAAAVAQSGLKPEATVALDTATAPVRTLAVHMPATEQQLADLPALQQVIDDELRHDVLRLEEYQIIWGAGTGEDLLGIMNTSGVVAARSVAGDTLLDRVRRAVSDISAAGLQPNALLCTPGDFEQMVLTKTTDASYLFQAFPDNAGRFRVWGLQVVESQALEAYRSANTTDQRVMIVGDFRRGATLWDRQQATVEIGYVNDQFIRNQRTIRAEERVAFAVRRPYAFRFIETQAAVL